MAADQDSATVTELHPTTASDPTPIPTSLNISELARKFGVDRRTIQRRLKKGWTPPTRRTKRSTKPTDTSRQDVPHLAPQIVPQPMPQDAPHLAPQPAPPNETALLCPPAQIQREPGVTPDRHDGHPEGSRVAGVLLAGTALILAGVGLLTNAQFAASLGQTPVSSTLLAALGFAIDGLALILPSVATVLWRGSHRLASVSAWAVWAGAVTVTLIAAAGFAAGNIGDSVSARGAKIAERAELTSRIETLKERHKEAIAAAERARAAECVKVGPVCRQRETALAAVLAGPEIDLKTAMTTLAALPPVVAGDPAGEMIAAWSDGAVSATAVHRVRVAGLTVMPATAGLLLSFAWLAWPARRQEAER
jgi:hypothetical protein